MHANYRIGIDLGINSLGWCLLNLDANGEPCGILDIGARIFKDARDPQSRASLAATRREARAMRRQRDRRLRRKRRLMDALIRHGLMPRDETERKRLESLDPYKLRARGLNEKLTNHELGRALFHIAQRRGFQSNLKADRKEKGRVTKQAKEKLKAELGSDHTLGEFLCLKGVGIAERKLNGKTLDKNRLIRFRPHARGANPEYDFYPTRAMYRHEFDKLWEKQADLGLQLTDDARKEIEDIIFHQRQFLPVPVGKCTFERNDERAPEALPLAQRFRILQELNNLEWIDRDRRGHRLDDTQRRKILVLLERQKTVSFKKMRSTLGLGTEIKFNLESEKRKELKGDNVAYEMAKDTRFGERWRRMSLERQNTVIERLLGEEIDEDDEKVLHQLGTEWKLTMEQMNAVLEAPLPDRHFRLGRIAIRKMLPELERGLRYHEAAKAVGYDHAKRSDVGVLDKLPYYGELLKDYTAKVPSASDLAEQRFGRLANPTVHVALNQVRRVINEIIERYGHPNEVVIELARELPLGKEDLQKREWEQKENQDRNENMREEIKTLLRGAGATEGEIQSALQRGDAVLRMRLWKELGKPPDTLCPYTLKPIGVRRLFSQEVHIDHILPSKRTADDSYANKTLCLHRANEIKANKTPWEAFHGSPQGYDWERILLQSENLPKNKRWRFAENAMEQFERRDRFGVPRELADQFTAQDRFLARHLIDTQYIARVTRQYLTAICDSRNVWPITGSMTALLRGKWNLSALLPGHNVQAGNDRLPAKKSRLDHRHHAIDAFVVACTSRSMLQRIAGAADDRRDRVIEKMPEPWDGFREQLREALRQITVSFRPDHGSTGVDPVTGRTRTTGALHKLGAYFPLSEPAQDGTSEVVSRKQISDFKTMEEVEATPDSTLRMHLKAFVEAKVSQGKKIGDACAAFVEETGIRNVRIRERLKIIPIRDRAGRIYKAYKGDSNDYMEIWQLPDGAWTAQTVSTFEANQPPTGGRTRPHPAAKLLMKLFVDDLVRLEDGAGQVRTMRIVKTSKQTVVLADHFESGNLKDRDDKTRKARRAADEKRLLDGRDPASVLAETGGFEYFSRAASSLRALKFRKLHVSPAGRVHDPGPPK